MISIRPVLALSLAGALVLSACGSDGNSSSDSVAVVTPTINVGKTADPLNQLLAEIYTQGLDNAGYRVGRKDPLADEAAAMSGLQADNVQFVPQFTSSLLAYLVVNGKTPAPTTSTEVTTTEVPATDPASTDPASTDSTATDPTSTDPLTTEPARPEGASTAEQMADIRSRLPDGLTVFEPAGVDNKLVVACGADPIDKFSLASISDLAGADITLGGTADVRDATVGGLAALNTIYGTDLKITVVPDVAATVADGTVDCGVLPGLTAGIIMDGLIVLTDDKFFAVDDSLVVVMTVDAGQADVQSVISAIDANLTTDVIRSLLVKVTVGTDGYDVVAKQFLASVATNQ